MRVWNHRLGRLLLLALPLSPISAALAEDSVEFYSKIHLSLDYANDGASSAAGLSNNSSRFGFKGTHQATPDLGFYWLLEQKVNVDESDGRFANPSYAGLDTPYGKFQAGYMDTPYKSLVSPFNPMDDTIADVRSIIGYSALGKDTNRNLNVRARNAVMAIESYDKFTFSLLYSFDYSATGTPTGPDNNEFDGYSFSLTYKDKGLLLGVASERWQDAEKLSGMRLGARYDFGSFNTGVIVESIESTLTPAYHHDAIAVDLSVPFMQKHTLKVQLSSAGDYRGMPDSGARQFAIGDYYAVSKALKFYAIYSSLQNDANAQYRLGGNGDNIYPVYGDSPWAASLGLIYRIDHNFF